MAKNALEIRIKGNRDVDIDDLVPLQGELKKLSDENFNKLRKSMIDKGFKLSPHVWDNGGKIYMIDGHQRLYVMQQMRKEGWDIPPIPCVFIEAETYSEAKETVLLAVSQYGKLDKQGFHDFVEGEGFQLDDYDFPDTPDDFFDDLVDDEDQAERDEKEDDVPDIPEDDNPYGVQRGDIWKLGKHRLMCGDSTSEDDVALLMGGEKADMVFTDPPYNVSSDSKNYAGQKSGGWHGSAMSKIKNSDWDKDFKIEPALDRLVEHVSDNSTMYIWTSHYLIASIWGRLKDFGYSRYLVWCKTNPMPSMSKRHPCFNTELCAYFSRGTKRVCNYPNGENFLSSRILPKKSDGTHPTQKPLELIKPILEFSSNKGQVVLDLFLGSGSTLIACEKTNRTCYGMEIDIGYVNVIIKRWEEYSGETAERLSNG